mgnify:CR=1 FL=1|jgi:hypothetical protein
MFLKRKTFFRLLIILLTVIIISALYYLFLSHYSIKRTFETIYIKDYPEKGLQKIETNYFSIITPKGWKHVTGFGIDNVFGHLITRKFECIHYDFGFICSSNPVVESEEEIIAKSINWNSFGKCFDESHPRTLPTNFKIIEITELGKDSIFYDDLLLCRRCNRKALIDICDTIIEVCYSLNELTKTHKFHFKEIDGAYIKIIEPLNKNGYTGMYNFCNKSLYGRNLSERTSKELLKAIETIEWKDFLGLSKYSCE